MIPRVFHFIWLGSELPAHLEAYIDTWRERHPSWVFNVWHEEDLPVLANQELFDHASEIAPGSEGQLQADIARYEILWHYGGVYVDVDMECRQAIDDLCRGQKMWAAWEHPGRWVGNSILASDGPNSVLAELIYGLRDNVRRLEGEGVRPNQLTGPQFLTPIWLGARATVLPKDWFYPYLYNELHRDREEFPEAYAVHHWNNKRSALA